MLSAPSANAKASDTRSLSAPARSSPRLPPSVSGRADTVEQRSRPSGANAAHELAQRHRRRLTNTLEVAHGAATSEAAIYERPGTRKPPLARDLVVARTRHQRHRFRQTQGVGASSVTHRTGRNTSRTPWVQNPPRLGTFPSPSEAPTFVGASAEAPTKSSVRLLPPNWCRVQKR